MSRYLWHMPLLLVALSLRMHASLWAEDAPSGGVRSPTTLAAPGALVFGDDLAAEEAVRAVRRAFANHPSATSYTPLLVFHSNPQGRWAHYVGGRIVDLRVDDIVRGFQRAGHVPGRPCIIIACYGANSLHRISSATGGVVLTPTGKVSLYPCGDKALLDLHEGRLVVVRPGPVSSQSASRTGLGSPLAHAGAAHLGATAAQFIVVFATEGDDSALRSSEEMLSAEALAWSAGVGTATHLLERATKGRVPFVGMIPTVVVVALAQKPGAQELPKSPEEERLRKRAWFTTLVVTAVSVIPIGRAAGPTSLAGSATRGGALSLIGSGADSFYDDVNPAPAGWYREPSWLDERLEEFNGAVLVLNGEEPLSLGERRGADLVTAAQFRISNIPAALASAFSSLFSGGGGAGSSTYAPTPPWNEELDAPMYGHKPGWSNPGAGVGPRGQRQ